MNSILALVCGVVGLLGVAWAADALVAGQGVDLLAAGLGVLSLLASGVFLMRVRRVHASRQARERQGERELIEREEGIVLQVALQRRGHVTAGEVAAASGLPVETVRQVLRRLEAAGGCHTHPGPDGQPVFHFEQLGGPLH